MRICEPFLYWLSLPTREDLNNKLTWSTYARYAPLMLAVTLPFLLAEVREFTGLSFEKMLGFALIHMAWNAIWVARGAPKFAHMENALFTAALPILAFPYQPWAWIFFMLSAANDAVICKPSPIHGAYITLVPWVAFGLAGIAYGGPHMTLGTVALVSVLAGVIYLWIAELMRLFDRLTEENHQLRNQKSIQQEHERISRDMHDGLGSTLTGLTLRCEVAIESLERDPALARRSMAEISILAREALRRVRLTVGSMISKPATLDEFHSMLRNVANEVCAGRCEVVLVKESDKPVNAELSYNLLLLGAEALSNAIRHGQAKRVLFRFHWSEDCWGICVRDDGCGVADGNIEVRTISQRVKRLGARLELARLADGTLLRVFSSGCPHDTPPTEGEIAFPAFHADSLLERRR
jgi:signal transduction histidine kinase